MNRIRLIIFIFSFIIIFCFVGAFFIQGSTEVKEEEDILIEQNRITSSMNVYGYTLDNPNVIINPYKLNNNSALIMFETKNYVKIKVNVNDMYNYVSEETNKHYIGVYNLIYGSNNVTLYDGNKKYEIEINIENDEYSSLLETGILLSNNHFLIPTDKYNEDNNYTGVREVDALGKIYFEYLLEDGYKGVACEIDEEKLAILSKKLIILDRQNGDIITSYDISSYNYNWYAIDYIDSNIILYSDSINLSIDEEGNLEEYDGAFNKKYLSNNINYSNKEGIRFYKELVTEKSKKNIWLLSYSKKMKNKIDVKKEFNRIIISSKDINDCNAYLILDKLLDKRVYELCNNVNYIYSYDFKGKYSIYFKIDGKVYKTDKYLNY